MPAVDGLLIQNELNGGLIDFFFFWGGGVFLNLIGHLLIYYVIQFCVVMGYF